jgi:hypothetical protein
MDDNRVTQRQAFRLSLPQLAAGVRRPVSQARRSCNQLGEVRETSDDALLSLPDLGKGSVAHLRETLGLPTSKLIARYSVLHEFAVGACSRDDGQAWQGSIDEFQCAECGAVYDVAITRLAARADYDAICDVCQKVMSEWHGTVGRAYTLKSQSAMRSYH